MLPSRPQRDAVVGPRQVLGREPEVDRVAGDLVERPRRREPRLERLLAAVHRRRRLADHLDVAERVVDVAAAEVEVVEPERLLEHGRVLVLGQRQHRLAVVEHVVAADLARTRSRARRGAGRWPTRAAARPSWPRRTRRRRDRRGTSPSPPSCSDHHAGDRRARRRRSRAGRPRALVSSVTFGYSSAGRTPSTSASDFACTRQGKPSHVAQRTQVLNGGFASSRMTPHGAWKGW